MEKESYAKRLQQASREEFRKFWSGYRILVTFSGLVAPVILQIQRGIHSVISLAEAVESGAIGLLLSLSGTYLYSRRKGAEALDADRESQLETVRRDADHGRATVSDQAAQIKSLQETIQRKHPHDEKKESDICKVLNGLPEVQQRAFAWLLDAGEASRGALQKLGLDADWFHGRTDFPRLLTFRSFRPGNGTVEIDRFYSINPEMKDALRNVLYPPPRA